MSATNSIRALAVLAAGGLVFLGACSDAGDDVAGPPIPTLGATSSGSGSGVETVAAGTMNEQAPCVGWSCTIGDCGYDPATDPRGACCVEHEVGGDPIAPPNCVGPGPGPGIACSEAVPGSCTDLECRNGNFCTCCYALGGHGP